MNAGRYAAANATFTGPGTRERTAADAARVGTRASPVRRAPLASSSAEAQRKPHRSDLPQFPLARRQVAHEYSTIFQGETFILNLEVISRTSGNGSLVIAARPRAARARRA